MQKGTLSSHTYMNSGAPYFRDIWIYSKYANINGLKMQGFLKWAGILANAIACGIDIYDSCQKYSGGKLALAITYDIASAAAGFGAAYLGSSLGGSIGMVVGTSIGSAWGLNGAFVGGTAGAGVGSVVGGVGAGAGWSVFSDWLKDGLFDGSW